MFKFIKIIFELMAPIVLIFVILPRMLRLVKDVLGFDSESKKDIKKAKEKAIDRHFRQLGNGSYRTKPFPPPPPPPRNELLSRRERMAKELDQYEVRGGRIVKKRLPSSVKVGEKMSLDYESDLSIEEEFGLVKSPPLVKVKNKHFNKGVDPDFL